MFSSITESELAKERSRLKILIALSKAPLAWSELLVESRVSNNTLSKTLQQLKKERIVKEALNRGETKHLQALYSLTDKARKELADILRILAEFKRIEEMAEEFTIFMKNLASAKKKDLSTISKEYFKNITDLSLAVLEEGLLYDLGNSSKQTLIASEAMSTIRKILWSNWLLTDFATDIKKDMNADKHRVLEDFEEHFNDLKKKYPAVTSAI